MRCSAMGNLTATDTNSRRKPVKKTLRHFSFLPAVLGLVASPVQGMIYMWKDSAGIAHYSNKEYDVPDRYKARVKMMYPDASDSATAPSGSAPAFQTPASTAVQPPAAVTQSAKPANQPGVHSAAPAPQVTTPPAHVERRARKQRLRSRNSDE